MTTAANADPKTHLLYHFCRLRLPAVPLPVAAFERHLRRSFDMFLAKIAKEGRAVSWEQFVADLHTLDWFVACACLERQPRAWEFLFAARASRTDTLLVDALRARVVRFFPRDRERQDEAVSEFWGYLLAGEKEGSVPYLARYDGQRPLVPWLIRVFQNKILSELRPGHDVQFLPDEEMEVRAPPAPDAGAERWHEEFRAAGREWLDTLKDHDLLLLGLRLRYRMSQREAAGLLGIHEGNISRQTAKLRDGCFEAIGAKLQSAGWTGDDLAGFVNTEMESLLLDEPRLSADRLAGLLAARGKTTSAKATR